MDHEKFKESLKALDERTRQANKPMTIRDIIEEYLVNSGYNGLFNPDYECG